MDSTMLPGIFKLGCVPPELRPYIYNEEHYLKNEGYPRHRVFCQRTVYLTVLTLRAILSSTYPTYKVFWQIRDTFGIETRIYLFNEGNGVWIELAEVVCSNNRELVRGVKTAPQQFTGTWELDGTTGLRHLLIEVASTVRSSWPSLRWSRFQVIGTYIPSDFGRLIQPSSGVNGPASFIRSRT